MRLTLPFLLPSVALLQAPRPSWATLRHGLAEGWMSCATVVEIALQVMEDDPQASDDVVTLAGLTRDELDEADALVDRLRAEEQLPAEPDYWRRRALNWLYDHRDDVIDPLGVVEELYAHFGYPEDMASFVRYMPPVDWTPQPGRPAENLAHLMRAWARFNAGAPSADE